MSRGVYLASVSTRHFDYLAVGRTQAEALKAVRQAVDSVFGSYGQKPVSKRELDDLGLSVQYVPFGLGLVDNEPFYASPEEVGQ